MEANRSTPFLHFFLRSTRLQQPKSIRRLGAPERLDRTAHWFFFAVQSTGGRPILASSCLNAGSP
jgi:hypothetical protein